MSNNLIEEKIKVFIESSDDIDTANVESATYQTMVGAGRALVQVETKTQITVGKKLTLQLKQATAADGTGAKNLGDPAVFTATGTEVAKAVKEVRASDLDSENGFKFIGYEIGTDLGSAVIAAAVIILGELSYSQTASSYATS